MNVTKIVRVQNAVGNGAGSTSSVFSTLAGTSINPTGSSYSIIPDGLKLALLLLDFICSLIKDMITMMRETNPIVINLTLITIVIICLWVIYATSSKSFRLFRGFPIRRS